MKKNLKIIFIIILIFALLIPLTYSYAISLIEPEKNEKQFFEISKTEVTKNEKVEMAINLDTVKYNEFIFELESDAIIENLEITQNDEIKTEKNNNEIVMEINKAKTNVETINLFYSVPESKKVGDTIKFIATITSTIENDNNKEDSQLLDQTNVIVSGTEEVETDNKEQIETQSIEIEIKIIEETNDNKQENDNIQTQIPNGENNKQDENKNNISSNKMPSVSINNSYMQSGSMGSQVQKVVYKGSDNNYLKKLSVKGCTLNREFSKENTTYFITVEKETKKLNITATAQDDDAIVCVYGNNNLKEGTNKILITVTAENGNVRNYRIYVTKNS